MLCPVCHGTLGGCNWCNDFHGEVPCPDCGHKACEADAFCPEA
jgi:hypothetical protein